MFDPICDGNIPKENTLLQDQALAMGEQNAVLPNVVPLFYMQVRQELVQSFSFHTLLDPLRGLLELGSFVFQRGDSFCQRSPSLGRCSLHPQSGEEVGKNAGTDSHYCNEAHGHPGIHVEIISKPGSSAALVYPGESGRRKERQEEEVVDAFEAFGARTCNSAPGGWTAPSRSRMRCGMARHWSGNCTVSGASLINAHLAACICRAHTRSAHTLPARSLEAHPWSAFLEGTRLEGTYLRKADLVGSRSIRGWSLPHCSQ